MGEERILAWSDIDYKIKEITYNGKYYFTMGHIKEGYYCLIYKSTDEYSAVVVVNQQESLQQAASKAIEEFAEKLLTNGVESPAKVIYHSPSDKGIKCYGKKQEIWLDLSELSDLINATVERKIKTMLNL